MGNLVASQMQPLVMMPLRLDRRQQTETLSIDPKTKPNDKRPTLPQFLKSVL